MIKVKLWRTKLKNNLKAIHNNYLHYPQRQNVVANQVKEQFESNSQRVTRHIFLLIVVANQVKEQFESNSQRVCLHTYRAYCCGEPS